MLKPFVRTLAFLGKELNEVRRQPRLLLSLILGPFVILLLFGLGYQGNRPPIRTALVVPPGQVSEGDIELVRQTMEPTFKVVAVDDTEERAMGRLVAGEVDLVEIMPANVENSVLEGRQSPVQFRYNEINPLDEQWVQYLGYTSVTELNRRIVIASVAELQQEVRSDLDRAPPGTSLQGARRFTQLPPEVLVSPLKQEYNNISGQALSLMAFYAPSVLALVLQHIAVTFGGLSLVRERLAGALEFFGVAPVSPLQIILGKTLAYLLVLALLAAGLTGILLLLGIPLRGDPWTFAGVLTLFSLASLGVGFLISSFSRSDTQAVQLSMLTLLLSVFFGGFFLPLESFSQPVAWVGWIVPLTWGIVGLREVMLLGEAPGTTVWIALSVLAALTFLAALLNWRRQMGRL